MADKKKTMRHASALKAKRQAIARQAANSQIRTKVRNLTTKVLKSIAAKNLEEAKTDFKKAQSEWQKAAKRGIFHQNAANRGIARMATRLAASSKS